MKAMPNVAVRCWDLTEKTWFQSGLLYMTFMVDKVALEQIFLQLHHCSVFIYHCPQRLCNSPDLQHSVTLLNFRLGDSYLPQHLAITEQGS
jgi:hypothetical protein